MDLSLFRKLLRQFEFYLSFAITDQTGEPLTEAQSQTKHLARVVSE